MRRPRSATAAADRRIDAAYRATCYSIPIPVLEIPRLFARGRAMIAGGADDSALRAAIRELVESLLTPKQAADLRAREDERRRNTADAYQWRPPTT